MKAPGPIGAGRFHRAAPTMRTMNAPNDGDSRLRLRPDDVHWREVEGEVIALDERASVYLAANPTATMLWRALAAGATRADLVSILTETFGIDAGRAGHDVDAFLEDLRSRDLLGDERAPR